VCRQAEGGLAALASFDGRLQEFRDYVETSGALAAHKALANVRMGLVEESLCGRFESVGNIRFRAFMTQMIESNWEAEEVRAAVEECDDLTRQAGELKMQIAQEETAEAQGNARIAAKRDEIAELKMKLRELADALQQSGASGLERAEYTEGVVNLVFKEENGLAEMQTARGIDQLRALVADLTLRQQPLVPDLADALADAAALCDVLAEKRTQFEGACERFEREQPRTDRSCCSGPLECTSRCSKRARQGRRGDFDAFLLRTDIKQINGRIEEMDTEIRKIADGAAKDAERRRDGKADAVVVQGMFDVIKRREEERRKSETWETTKEKLGTKRGGRKERERKAGKREERANAQAHCHASEIGQIGTLPEGLGK
jgi:hypothetical protein